MKYLGTPYVWGAPVTPASTVRTDHARLMTAGIDFPHYSGAQYKTHARTLVDIEPVTSLFYGYDGDSTWRLCRRRQDIEAEMTGTSCTSFQFASATDSLVSVARGASRVGVPTSFSPRPLVFHTYGFGLRSRPRPANPLRSATTLEV